MAIAEGVTEIQDSEEEPMTSSPVKFPEPVIDKLAAEKPSAYQKPRAGTQGFNGTQQGDASQAGTIPSGLDGLSVNQSPGLGAAVQSKIEMQQTQQEGAKSELNQKQPTPNRTLNVENIEVKEQLYVERDSENNNLPPVVGGSEQLSTSQVFPEDGMTVARNSSPPQERCDSSTMSCNSLAKAMEHPSIPKLEHMNEKLQQVEPDHGVQAKVYQADNDTVSDFAVNAPRSLQTAITEHGGHKILGPVLIDYAQGEDTGVEDNTAALLMEMDVPANHLVLAQNEANAEHDLFHSTAVSIPVPVEDTNNEKPQETVVEFVKLVGLESTREIAMDPPLPGTSLATDYREASADKWDVPIIVDKPDLNVQGLQERENVILSTPIGYSQSPPNHLLREEELRHAHSHSTSGIPNDTASSAAAAGLDLRKRSSLPAIGSIISAYPISSESSLTSSRQTVIPKTSQEITLAELRAQKAALLASLVALPAVQVVIEEQTATNAGTSDDGEPGEADVMAAANKIVKEHIKLLHEYNELKDMGQGLMGLIADQRGVRIVEVQSEFGIEAQD